MNREPGIGIEVEERLFGFWVVKKGYWSPGSEVYRVEVILRVISWSQ